MMQTVLQQKYFVKDSEYGFCGEFDSYDYNKSLDDNIVTGVKVDAVSINFLDSVRFGSITKSTTRQEFLSTFDGIVEEIVANRENEATLYQYTIYDIENSKSSLSAVFSDDELVIISGRL